MGLASTGWGPHKHTNNTGELHAIAEALAYALQLRHLSGGYYPRSLLICTDSQYCLTKVTGRSRTTSNWVLVKQVLSLMQDWLRLAGVTLEFMKVQAHADDAWNNAADYCAKAGVGLSCPQVQAARARALALRASFFAP